MKKSIFIIFLVALFIFPATPSDAFLRPFFKGSDDVVRLMREVVREERRHPLDENEVRRLASDLSGRGSSSEVRDEARNRLARLKLSEAQQEHLFLEIAVHQKKISGREASSMYANLNGVDGFSRNLSKIVGANRNGTQGHLTELRIASESKDLGFDVLSISEKFKDLTKKALTDLDLKLRANGRNILVEVKDYTRSGGMPPMDSIRADMQSLMDYQIINSDQNALRVYAINPRPSKPTALRRLEEAAKSHGVCLVYGSPREVAVSLISLSSRNRC